MEVYLQIPNFRQLFPEMRLTHGVFALTKDEFRKGTTWENGKKPLCLSLCQELNKWCKYLTLSQIFKWLPCLLHRWSWKSNFLFFYLHASPLEVPTLVSVNSCSTEMITFFPELSCSFINTIGLSTHHCIKNNMNSIVSFCFNQEYLPYAWQKRTIFSGRIFDMFPKFTFELLTLLKTTLSCCSIQFAWGA